MTTYVEQLFLHGEVDTEAPLPDPLTTFLTYADLTPTAATVFAAAILLSLLIACWGTVYTFISTSAKTFIFSPLRAVIALLWWYAQGLIGIRFRDIDNAALSAPRQHLNQWILDSRPYRIASTIIEWHFFFDRPITTACRLFGTYIGVLALYTSLLNHATHYLEGVYNGWNAYEQSSYCPEAISNYYLAYDHLSRRHLHEAYYCLGEKTGFSLQTLDTNHLLRDDGEINHFYALVFATSTTLLVLAATLSYYALPQIAAFYRLKSTILRDPNSPKRPLTQTEIDLWATVNDYEGGLYKRDAQMAENAAFLEATKAELNVSEKKHQETRALLEKATAHRNKAVEAHLLEQFKNTNLSQQLVQMGGELQVFKVTEVCFSDEREKLENARQQVANQRKQLAEKRQKVNNQQSSEDKQLTKERRLLVEERESLAKKRQQLDSLHNQLKLERQQLADERGRQANEHQMHDEQQKKLADEQNLSTHEHEKITAETQRLADEHQQITMERQQLVGEQQQYHKNHQGLVEKQRLINYHESLATEREQLADVCQKQTEQSQHSQEHQDLVTKHDHLANEHQQFLFQSTELLIQNSELSNTLEATRQERDAAMEQAITLQTELDSANLNAGLAKIDFQVSLDLAQEIETNLLQSMTDHSDQILTQERAATEQAQKRASDLAEDNNDFQARIGLAMRDAQRSHDQAVAAQGTIDILEHRLAKFRAFGTGGTQEIPKRQAGNMGSISTALAEKEVQVASQLAEIEDLERRLAQAKEVGKGAGAPEAEVQEGFKKLRVALDKERRERTEDNIRWGSKTRELEGEKQKLRISLSSVEASPRRRRPVRP